MELYRFVKECDYDDDNGDMLVVTNRRVVCKSYNVIRETNASWIIEDDTTRKGKRVISKTSRKKFAYPEQRDALINYITRAERHIKILQYSLEDAKTFLEIAKKIAL